MKTNFKSDLKPIIISLFIALLFVPQECHSKKNSLMTLDEENWDQMLSGEWMVEFFAPWCPACRSMQSDWKSFADWSQDLRLGLNRVVIWSIMVTFQYQSWCRRRDRKPWSQRTIYGYSASDHLSVSHWWSRWALIDVLLLIVVSKMVSSGNTKVPEIAILLWVLSKRRSGNR